MDVGREEPSRIKELLKNNPRGMNVTEIAREIGMNRLSVAKYLEMLLISGHIEVKAFGPSKVYFLSQRLPISAMLSLSSDFILILDKDLRIINVNDRFLEFGKLKRSDILYQKFDTLSFPLEFRPSLLPSVIAALNGENFTAEAYFKKKGAESFFNIKFIPLVFDDGQKGVTLLFEDITERKRIELAVKESELKLRSIIEQSRDGITLTDEQGRIIEYNKGEEEMIGISREKAIGSHIWDIQASLIKDMHGKPEFRDHLKASLQKVLKSGKIPENQKYMEFEIDRPDGSKRTIHIMTFSIQTEKGYMVCSITRDITERKLDEQKLKESETQFRSIFEQAAVGIAYVDKNDYIKSTNKRFCDILGYEQGELIDLTYKDITYTDDIPRTEECLERLKNQEISSYTLEKRYFRKDGSTVWTNVTVSLLHVSDADNYHVVIIEDITARKQAEEALQKAELHLAKAQEIAQIGSWEAVFKGAAADVSHMHGQMSDELYRILGVTPNSPVTDFNSFLEIVHPDDKAIVLGMTRDLINKNGGDHYDIRILPSHGPMKILHCESDLELDEHDNIVKLFGTMQDITERKRIEEALRKAHDELEKTVDERTLALKNANESLQSEIIEKARAEEALREAKEYAENLIETANVIVLGLDIEGKVKVFNKAAEKITGYSKAEMIGRSWEVIIPRDRYAYVWKEFERLVDGGLPKNFENPILTKSGGERYIAWQNNDLIEHGRIVGSISFGVDITDRKMAEKALRESEARYRAFFENSMDALLLTTPEGSVLAANPAACSMYGMTEEEVKGLGRAGLVDQSDPQLMVLLNEREQTGHYFGELRAKRKGGTVFPTEHSSGMFTDDKGHEYNAVIIRDITARKQMEEKLEKFRLFSENTRDIVLFVGPDGWIVEANDAAIKAYGYSYDELLSLNIYALRMADPRQVVDGQMSIAYDEGLLFETIHRRKDGSTFPVEVSTQGMMIGDKKILLSVVRDITERKKAEDALWEKQEKLEIQAEELESQAEELRINNDELEKEIEYRQKAQAALEASEVRFRSLIQNSSDIIRILDKNGLIIYDSPSSVKILGYPEGFMIGKSPIDFIHPDDRDMVKNDLGEVINEKNTGVPTEFRIRKASGEYLNVESVGMNMLGVPGVDGIVITTRAITERKRAEEAIRISEHKYRNLVENISDGAWEIDKNLTYTYMSSRSIPIIGYAPEELLGKTPYDLMDPEEAKRVKSLLYNVSTAELPFSLFECKILHKDGHTIHVEISGDPIFNINGAFAGYRGVTRDITQRKKDKAELSNTNRALRLITDCNHALIRSGTEQDLLSNICDILVDIGGYRLAWVGYKEHDEQKSIRPITHAGRDNGYIEAIKLTWSDDGYGGMGPGGMAIRNGSQSILRWDGLNAQFIPWSKEALNRGLTSIIGLPLMEDRQAFGVLLIYSDQMDAFNDTEVELLEELSDNMSYRVAAIRARSKR